ncbi:MAG: nucleoside-diphosphate kinase [Flavobacteriales bacterium]|nr:nucleoside-diphosphate kinase [Flavobacteriales bacterium]MBO72415.1 nucleoside-diphosphate kinase [Flavobacteriales bacterium]|tara:strand:+ start:157 stop:579 length:423 start_codon:yes stop_codon:yes gene_type:complete
MSGNITFTMIKPMAMRNGAGGAILKMIQDGGFEIIALKMKQMSKSDAEEFYGIHKDKPFYENLVEFMTSGPIIAAVLKKDNAVEDYRKLLGSTNPETAEEGTIRRAFATNMTMNAAHGSDSDENAIIETKFHFKDDEIFN